MKKIFTWRYINKQYWVNFIFELFFALYLFWGLQPYFTWETYNYGVFKRIGPFLFTSIFFIICLAVLVLKNSNGLLKLKKSEVHLMIGIIVAAFVLLGICGGNYHLLFSGSIIPYFMLLFFFFLPDEMKIHVYKIYFIIFVITILPAIIYYVFNIMGFHLPYSILSSYEKIKVSGNLQYRLYPFAVQLQSLNPLAALRMCGIYDEGGKLGTIAGLFLVSEQYSFKKNRLNIIVLIAGVLSFSLSFFLITVIYFLLSNAFKKKIKNAVILLIIIVVYLFFTNVTINIPVLKTLQSRMMITSTGLAGDNRTNDAYDQLFEQFQKSDFTHLMFGFGDGAIGKLQNEYNIDGSSYKSLLFNYGYFGFAFSIMWILAFSRTMVKRYKENTDFIIIATIIYLLNLYQRPSMFFPSYMIIYIGGVFLGCHSREELGENEK